MLSSAGPASTDESLPSDSIRLPTAVVTLLEELANSIEFHLGIDVDRDDYLHNFRAKHKIDFPEQSRKFLAACVRTIARRAIPQGEKLAAT